MRRTRLLGTAIASAIVLNGCSIGVVADADRQIKSTRNDAADLRKTAERPLPAADVSPIKVVDGVYLGSKAERIEYGDPLPTAVERGGFTLIKTAPLHLGEIATAITEVSGIPVVLAADITSTSSSSALASGPSAASMIAAGASGGQQGAPEADSALGAALSNLAGGQVAASTVLTADDPTRQTMKVNYTGKLSGFLDLVGAHFNVAWSHQSGRITLQRTETRTFDIPWLPVVTDLSFTMSSGSNGGQNGSNNSGGVSGSQQTATTTSKYAFWDEVNTTLQSIVGKNGDVKVNTIAGTVTVSASPSVVKRVAEYLKTVNKNMSQQIALDIKVLTVNLSDSDAYDVNLNAIFSGSSKFGFNIANAMASSATGGIGLNWGIIAPGSSWQGTKGVIEALSERGDVSVRTSASVTTVNGAPVPLQDANTRGFVRDRSTSVDNGTITNDINTDEVTTGFNLHLVPRILKNGNLLLQYGMNISELVGKDNGFDLFGTDTDQVMLPNINQRNFIQQAIIPNGKTLVLAGFERQSSTTTKSGVGDPSFWGLGGSQSGKMKRDLIVILITPTLLDLGNASVN